MSATHAAGTRRSSAAHRGQSEPRQGIRCDIQAVRAIAVLAVLLYHLWPNRLPGGFTGVDVFFVVSGFVITKQLTRQARTATPRRYLIDFYARRIRRLAPAATLVLLSVVAASVLFEPVTSWPATMRQVTASAAFFQNWQLAHDAVSYLSAEAAPSAVQHYWSLSVEEQFYVFWPLVILLGTFLVTRGRTGAAARVRILPALIALVLFVSFAYSLHVTGTNPDAAYFVTPARVWQLAAGALLVFLPTLPRLLRLVLPWVGAATVMAGFFAIDGSMPYPGWAGVVPVAGAVLMLAGDDLRGRISFGTLSSVRPVQWLGDVSYSVYLWHWPIIVILPAVTGHPLSTLEKIGIVGVTGVLAWLSYRFVETPFRTARPLVRRAVPVYVIGAAFIAASVLSSQVTSATATGRIDRAVARLHAQTASPGPCFGARAIDEVSCPNPWGQVDDELVKAGSSDLPIPWTTGCKNGLGPDNHRVCTFGPATATTTVLLWGDSHSAAWAPAFAAAAEGHDVRVVAASRDGCPATLVAPTDTVFRHITRGEQKHCLARNRWVLKTLVPKADQVYIANMTTDYRFHGTVSGTIRGYARVFRALRAQRVPATMMEDVALTGDRRGDRVDAPACLNTNPASCRSPRTRALNTHRVVQGLVARGVDKFDYVPDEDRFCHGRYCYKAIGGISVYFDGSHISKAYSTSLGPWLWRAMQEAQPVTDYFD